MLTKPEYPFLCADGYCKGNPGPGGFRVMEVLSETSTPVEIYIAGYPLATNNLVEFLALASMLHFTRNNQPYKALYTDSTTAIAWLYKKQVKTNLIYSDESRKIYSEIATVLDTLRLRDITAQLTFVKKWDTKNWGEIPADFGNK